MIRLILNPLKRIFSDARTAIVSLIVAALLGGTGGFLYLYETSLNFFLELMQTRTPLWAATAMVFLLMVYIHLKISKNHSSYAPQYKSFLIEDRGFKWKVTDQENGDFHLESIPYCKRHDLQYLETKSCQFICPETIVSSCKEEVIKGYDDLMFFRDIAKSKADSIVNNYETKP